MCHASVLRFVDEFLRHDEVEGKDVLEVGSYDANGSPRALIVRHGPRSYLGVDLRPGPGVDEVCDAIVLTKRFGEARFDVVVSTEMLEHVADWRGVLSNLKRVLRPGGVCILTTRSPGFPPHDYPEDFWRYTVADIRTMFADCEIVTVLDDPDAPGVFAKVVRPSEFTERDLSAFTVAATPQWVPAAQLSERDKLIAELQAKLNSQCEWAIRSAAEVTRRDAIVEQLQASLDEQTAWARQSTAEVSRRDALISELQAALDEQTRWAQASAARVAQQEASILGLEAQLDESRRALAEALRERSRRRGPSIDALHPGWTETGRTFSPEDGP